MACKCIHHPEAVVVCRSIQKVSLCFEMLVAAWLAGLFDGCIHLLCGCSISWSCHGLQVHPSSRGSGGVQINPKGEFMF